jgi:hypothetical protein
MPKISSMIKSSTASTITTIALTNLAGVFKNVGILFMISRASYQMRILVGGVAGQHIRRRHYGQVVRRLAQLIGE